ncbi:MAG: 30S ribosomal protein S6 [Pseudomonadota bacterium]
MTVTKYEILLMLDPEMPEERQSEIVGRVRELVEGGGGTWVTHEVWGRRRLAYEIAKKTDGIYHLLHFDAQPETLDEISRVLKITDGVMRHLPTHRIEGSRTSAPAPAPAAVGSEGYGGANRRSVEEEEE